MTMNGSATTVLDPTTVVRGANDLGINSQSKVANDSSPATRPRLMITVVRGA